MAPNHLFCCPQCRWRAWSARRPAKPRRTRDPRTCVGCGDWFVPRRNSDRCCSMDCRQELEQWKGALVTGCQRCAHEFLSKRRRRFCSPVCTAAGGSSQRPGFVYFIQAESGGPVKLGFSANPEERLAGLQPGNPERLVIRRTVPGVHADEGRLHERFAALRVFGEWFAPEVLELP